MTAQEQKTILLVDDESIIALSEAEILKKEGYYVITAFSGKSAIEEVKKNTVDLILMDIDMGKDRMDGTEAASIILQDHDIHVVFLSSHREPEVVAKTEKITSYGYVVKGSSYTVLFASIKMGFKLHESHMKILEREKSLQASEEKYRRIVETTNEGIWVSSKDNTIVFTNPRMASMLGYSAEEMIGKSLTDFVHKDELEDFHNRVEKRKRGISEQFERRFLCKDGSFLWTIVSTTPINDENGNFQGSFAMVTDITERKRAEESLRESEQYFRSLIESSSDIIMVYDADNILCYQSPSAERIMGYKPEETIGKKKGSLVAMHPDDVALANNIAERAMCNPGVPVGPVQTRRQHRDGSWRWFEAIDTAMKQKSGKMVLVTNSRDITEHKLAEEALKQTMDKLRKSLSGTIQAMLLTIEKRDPYTSGHQRKVSNLARVIAQEMGLPKDIVENIRMAGIIHDIGKISIPAEILSKPCKISDIEMSLIKGHPQSGYDILKDVELPYPIAEIVIQHHERLDGSGYPNGLKGDQILIESRIIAVAEVVEAITSHRPYRPAKGIDVALEEIEKNKGLFYDREAVEACLRLFREKEFSFEPTKS